MINNKLIKWSLASLIMVNVISCGSSTNDNSGKNEINQSNTSNENIINHNGFRYKIVVSPYTGRIWLDRNLGAARICESFNDSACYGDYYQWGRNSDGHEDSRSTIISTLSKTVDDVGHNNFIINSISSYDWALVDGNGKKREMNWFNVNGNSVCPIGFRVPTISELKAELLDSGSAKISNGLDAFSSFLKLPSAGHRFRTSGDLLDRGTWGSIWSVSASGFRSSGIYFTPNKSGWYNGGGRANGRSVRCIKN